MSKAIAHALAEAWDEWSRAASFPFMRSQQRGYCVNATRVGIQALRAFGVFAKPASVTLVVLNQAADQLARAGVPVEQWPAHAWSVGVGYGDNAVNGGWDGHLLIDGGDWALDLSGEAYERQGRIDIRGPLLLPALPPLGERQAWTFAKHTFVIERAPQHNAWRRLNGWKVRSIEAEHELVARTKRHAEHAQAVLSYVHSSACGLGPNHEGGCTP